MKRVFGLETEYGITVSGAENVDVVAESIELVRRYTEHGALMKWDYELEDPHLEARVFTTITRIRNIPRRNAACSGKLSRRTRPANASWPSARGVETRNFHPGARFVFTKTTPTLSGTATVATIITLCVAMWRGTS